MSKIVTIPTDGGNPFVVILGGIKYVYKPGETVEVPDGVALEIEEWERWHEKYYGDNVPPFGAGGGTQPDWNQNDPNAADYVKNRPFYSINEEGFVAKEQTVQINGDGYIDLVIESAQIVEGDICFVTLNGTQYNCVAWWYDDWSAMMLGNGSFVDAEGMGEDVPFAIDLYPEDDTAYLNADEGTYTVSVEGYMGIKKLDPKYLPDVGGGGGCCVIVDVVDGNRVIATDGIYEKLENFLNNLEFTHVNAVYRQNANGALEYTVFRIRRIRYRVNGVDQINIECDDGMSIFIRKDGNHSYYYD